MVGALGRPARAGDGLGPGSWLGPSVEPEAAAPCHVRLGRSTAGYRSGLFAQKLRREYGLEAYNLKGSILAWVSAEGCDAAAPV